MGFEVAVAAADVAASLDGCASAGLGLGLGAALVAWLAYAAHLAGGFHWSAFKSVFS